MKYKFEDIAFNSTEKKKPVESDKSHYIGLEHLDSQCLTVNRYGSNVAPIGEKLIMKKGDVLFGKRRAYQKKVAIAPFDGIFSAHGFVLRPKENVIDKNFFPFFISSDYFLDKAISISVGSLSPTINWSDLKVIEFELPDLEEQKRLANILWKIEDEKQNIEKLTILTKDVITFELNKFINKNKKYAKSLETLENLSIITLNRGNVIPKSDSKKYPVYSSSIHNNGLMGYSNNYMFDEELVSWSIDGGGDFFYRPKHKYSITNVSGYIRILDQTQLSYKYLYYILKTLHSKLEFDYIKKAHPSVIRNIYYVPIVPLDEQNKFANDMDSLNKLIDVLQQKKKTLFNISNKIIKEALNV